MSDYIIVGDTEEYDECLIYVCGTPDNAENVLHRMLINPTDDDKRELQRHHNLRIKEVPARDCWWHGNCD